MIFEPITINLPDEFIIRMDLKAKEQGVTRDGIITALLSTLDENEYVKVLKRMNTLKKMSANLATIKFRDEQLINDYILKLNSLTNPLALYTKLEPDELTTQAFDKHRQDFLKVKDGLDPRQFKVWINVIYSTLEGLAADKGERVKSKKVAHDHIKLLLLKS